MFEQFTEHMRTLALADSGETILLTVSGGVDSIVMLDLFARTDYPFAIAHCNFQLRGDESDADEVFVAGLAEKYQCAHYVKRFETQKYCAQRRVSIQMGARDLRYTWFESLAADKGFSRIAVAHNKNDIAETMLINLIRGTGLKGMAGIAPKAGKIIRPLLFASRKEILEYADSQHLAYREDSSNRDTKYHRNLIRNRILPEMEKINPSVLSTLVQESAVFGATHEIYRREIRALEKELVEKKGNTVRISIAKISSLRISAPVLFDLLQPFRFTYSDADDILSCLQAESGKRFYSDDYVLLKDRNYLIIERKEGPVYRDEYSISRECREIAEPVKIQFDIAEATHDFRLPANNREAALNYDKLKFPLKLRRWIEGDFFRPLGMKGRKKLSDFFRDHKVNDLEKEKVWLLVSGEDIIWVLGMQIDDRYKITPDTKNIFTLRIID